jgi:ribosome recycling factor
MWQNVLKELESKMKKTVDVTDNELKSVRTGRATNALVEGIKVSYYGAPTPLKQLANISIPEPRLIVIQPWDVNAMKDVEKAIHTSKLGLVPSVEGKIIRIVVPPLSKERREELVKVVRKVVEEGKVALRTIRRDGNDQIKGLEKEKTITEDESFKAIDQIQKLTDRHTKSLDEVAGAKEKDLITV